jgi:hypothetical protein
LTNNYINMMEEENEKLILTEKDLSKNRFDDNLDN